MLRELQHERIGIIAISMTAPFALSGARPEPSRRVEGQTAIFSHVRASAERRSGLIFGRGFQTRPLRSRFL